VAVSLPLICTSDSLKKNGKTLDKSSGGGISYRRRERLIKVKRMVDPRGARVGKQDMIVGVVSLHIPLIKSYQSLFPGAGLK
jgi:hypothetical protein